MTTQTDFERLVSARLPTGVGEFTIHLYGQDQDDKEHLALVFGAPDAVEQPLVRVHSECLTGDVFGSQRCDCGEQLNSALAMMAEEGAGVLVYLRQEGRGIGLQDKLRAYNLQEQGMDTVEANLALGHQADARDYAIAARILADLGVDHIRLLTNNPDKIDALTQHGVDVVDRLPLQGAVNAENAAYLLTKATRMRHMLDLPADDPPADPADKLNGAA